MVVLAFATNVLIVLLGRPLISLLFREALQMTGQTGLDLANLSPSFSSILPAFLLLAIGLFAFAMVAVQLAILFVAIKQVWDTGTLSTRELLRGIRAVVRKLFRRSSIPIFFYVFLLLPISGLGFFSTLTQVIAIPNFISGELLKDPVTAVLWNVLMLVILWINIRCALALPLFFNSDASGTEAIRTSWRTVRGRELWALIVTTVAIGVPTILLAVVIALASTIPAMITDQGAPALSGVSASFSMAMAQIVLLIVVSTATVLWLAMLSTAARLAGATPDPLAESSDERDDHAYPSGPWRWGLVMGATALVVPLQLVLSEPVHALAAMPDTEILAHRGYLAGGVENTIPSLEAAAEVGADRVEMDVLQTADGQFVVMHDANLTRLAGQNVNVKDLTLDELTAITVRDQVGNSARIPSLAEYVTRAKEIDMPLLIEIKMGGLDTPDHVDLLVEELTELDALQGNTFHSLDHASVERLKELLPRTDVGYILAFAGVGVPDTSADFLVIEEYTATDTMHDAAADEGLGFYVWTVDDSLAQRVRIRTGADGIITDRPDTALESREEIINESGVTPALLDLMMGFVIL